MSMFGEWTIVARGLLFKVAIGIIKANVAALFILPIASVYQEQKVWKTPKKKTNGQKITKSQVPHLTLWGCIKVYIFNVGWFVLTGTGAIVLFPAYVLGFRTFVEKHASITVERYTGYILVHTFIGPVILNGTEHLPSSSSSSSTNTACVYIANHSSQIDAGAILFLWKRWKWIVKRSILFLPGVGWIMALGGHISINRSKKSFSKKQPPSLSSPDQKDDDKDKDNKASTPSASSSSSSSRSSSGIKYMYEEANRTLKNGNSILVFPQGTRRMTERLPFKDGAFNIAIAAEVPLVPISIEIPLEAWNSLYPISLLWKNKSTDISPVVLTVHKPIQVTKQSNKEILKKEAFDIIYSVLPDYTPKEE